MGDVRRRLRELRGAIRRVVVDEDGFGLNTEPGLALNSRFTFPTDDKKLAAYKTWLLEQVRAGILEVDPLNADTPWLEPYITSSYKKGVVRAYTDTKAATQRPLMAGADPSQLAFIDGTKAQFLEAAFAAPTPQAKLRTLATRAFSELKGMTATMDQEMTRVLADGLAHGKGPRQLASELNKVVSGLEKKRALTIARTEIVRAHVEGQLDSFEIMGMREVSVLAEWATAGDEKVCPLCKPMDGVVMTIEEARGLLPRHPNCRCAWLPTIPGATGTDRTSNEGKVKQVFGQRGIEDAIRKSLQAEGGKKRTTRQARARSTWPGADKKISTGKRKKKA